jgi:hypothetical protein
LNIRSLSLSPLLWLLLMLPLLLLRLYVISPPSALRELLFPAPLATLALTGEEQTDRWHEMKMIITANKYFPQILTNIPKCQT